MTLFGDAVIRISSLLWSKAHRMILMSVLRDASTAESARTALKGLSWLGLHTRTYSNRALTRLIEEYERQRKDADLPRCSADDIRTLVSNVVFMAPSLLEVSDKRFTEQQRHNARFELAASLILGLPLLIAAVTASLTSGPWPGVLGYGGALLVGAYALTEADIAWRDSNSQIAHALVDQKHPLKGISQNWDISRGVRASLPEWMGRLLRSRKTASLDGTGTASGTAQTSEPST
jgi:hypothetical protein